MPYSKATRRATPWLIEMSGVSGGGKTTSALLLAAGMAGPDGQVAFLDTENGRGSMLADSAIIKHALPNGYAIDELEAPFTPERYIGKIKDAESARFDVLIIDSTTHEFEGIGGISEIAETAKMKWVTAKMRHKKFLYHCLSSPMDIIFCFRARPKVKKVGETFEELGIQPIQEKNWNFDMTARWHLEDKSHHAHLLKAPADLEQYFTTPRLLTKQDGEVLRQWKISGAEFSPIELLRKRARITAEDGMAAYIEFWKELNDDQRRSLYTMDHAENKRIAEIADREIEAQTVPTE